MKAERKVKVVALRPHDQSLLLLLSNRIGFYMTFKPLSLSTVLKRICSICEDLICSVGLDLGFEEKTGVGLRIVGKGGSRTLETTIYPSIQKFKIVSHLYNYVPGNQRR